MILDRTLPRVLQVTAGEVPALAGRGRDRVVLVTDVEVLCSSIVVDRSRSDAPYVPKSRPDLYDALGFLLGQHVLLLPDYDPTRGQQLHDPYAGGFKGWLHLELTRDLIDYWRSWFGRHGQKRVADPHDDEGRGYAGVAGDDGDGRSGRERRLRGALHQDPGDRGDSGLDALRRGFLEGRDRALLREVAALGLGEAARVGGRAQGPDLELADDLERRLRVAA